MESIGTVSVIVPVHDAAEYLAETLDSILAQDYPDLEVVIVDDASTDDTPRVLETYRDRVRTIRLDEASGGPSRPRNTGVAASRGEFIAFCDSDDIWEPDAVSDSLGVMARHPEVGLSFSTFSVIDEAGEPLASDNLAEYRDFRRDLAPTDDPAVGLLTGDHAYSRLLRTTFIFPTSVVMRRGLWDSGGPFDETLKNGDDRDLWLRCALTGTVFAFIDRPHFAYRKRADSVSGRGWKRMPSIIRMLEKHLGLARTDADRQRIRIRLREARMFQAYGLADAGRLDESGAIYRRLLAERITFPALKGMLRVWVFRLTGRRPQ